MSAPQYDITWDTVKAVANITKHGVTFSEAATVLLDPLALTIFDAVHSEFEERWFTLGVTSSGRMLAVSHTFKLTTPNRQVRIISAREATHRERQQYEDNPR
ncbi:MAG: BrnT family toxin [Pseudomonadota bacterium]|nr:BrnT family toxin [Pseudomonadota bacterium]